MDIVEVKNICKTYQAFQMKDVSFSLEEGRITGSPLYGDVWSG